MKYWWLERYRNLKVVMLPELLVDLKMFLVMPKNYLERARLVMQQEVENLSESDLLILLYTIASQKRMKDSKIIRLIEVLLEFPDNSLPATDYTVSEMLSEVAGLSMRLPVEEKLDCNNIAACYHCLQVFYVEKIQFLNKKGLCLCPYCSSHQLYFDNDYIPMDFLFLKLAQLYSGVSPLGCKWKHLQKLLKKAICWNPDKLFFPSISILEKGQEKMVEVDRDQGRIYIQAVKKSTKLTSKAEMQLWRSYYYGLQELENLGFSSVVFLFPKEVREEYFYFTILLLLLEFLGKNPYFKEVSFVFSDSSEQAKMETLVQDFIRFS